MTSLKERIIKLEGINEMVDEWKKQRDAPKQTFWDKITGKKKLTKEFRLPNKARAGAKRKIKQNYSLVFYVRNNGNVSIYFAPIVDDLIYIKETGLYHSATADHVLRYNQYPALIIPEWSLKPFSVKESVKETLKEGEISFAQRAIIDIIKKAQLGAPKKLGGKTMLYILVAGAAVLYLLSQIIG